MTISLLDGALRVTIFYDEHEGKFEDNICVSFVEDCPIDEKVLKGDEVNIYITPQQARALAEALLAAAKDSEAGVGEAASND